MWGGGRVFTGMGPGPYLGTHAKPITREYPWPIYMAGFLKKEGMGIGGVGWWYQGMVAFVVTNYTVCQPLYTIINTQKKNFIFPVIPQSIPLPCHEKK